MHDRIILSILLILSKTLIQFVLIAKDFRQDFQDGQDENAEKYDSRVAGICVDSWWRA
jgi:hypothetical protein